MSECPIIVPKGIRWDLDVVKFFIDNTLPAPAQIFLRDEFAQLRVFVAKNSSLRVQMTDDPAQAQVKNVTIAPIDGPGRTLGVTHFYVNNTDILQEVYIVCDSADLGRTASSTKKHEFLHALGLDHNNVPGSLMYAFSSDKNVGYDDLAAEDLAARHPKQKPKIGNTKMARAIIPDAQSLVAMDFIRDFNLNQDQVAYRYTVAHRDKMCAEIGLPTIEGEKEAEKVYRLLTAIHAEKPALAKPKKEAANPAKEDEPA